MDKKQVDQLEDLQITQLMGMYAEEEGRRLMAENERLQNDPDFVVPEHFHDACLAAIQKAEEQERKKRLPSRAIKHLKHVAVLAVVLLGISGVMFVSVDAFKICILNTFVEYGDKSAKVEITEDSSGSLENELLCELTWVAEGYSFWDTNKSSNSFQKLRYTNENGELIEFFCLPNFSGTHTMDTEDAEYVEEIDINGNKAVVIIKDEIQVCWIIEEKNIFCNLCCNKNIPLEDAIKMAESVR